jgi:transcriptional regulator with XRE-family HTH domain
MDTGFGDLLKQWRTDRRMSQLDLGLESNVSARHISFLETGRARPSRAMVLQLSETMQVPRLARNALLTAAGFAEIYRHRDLNAAELEHIRAALSWTLDRHDPFPAFALDQHWHVVKANAAATTLLAAVDIRVGDSLLQALVHGRQFRNAFENWAEIAGYFIARLRTENAHLGGDPILSEAITALAKDGARVEASGASELSAITPTRYRFNGAVLSFVSTIAQFGTAEDIALADLKIELMFPANEATRQVLLAAQPDKALLPNRST